MLTEGVLTLFILQSINSLKTLYPRYGQLLTPIVSTSSHRLL